MRIVLFLRLSLLRALLAVVIHRVLQRLSTVVGVDRALLLLRLVVGEDVAEHLRAFLTNTADPAPGLRMSGADPVDLHQDEMRGAVQGETLAAGSARGDDDARGMFGAVLVRKHGSRRQVLELLHPERALRGVQLAPNQAGVVVRVMLAKCLAVLALPLLNGASEGEDVPGRQSRRQWGTARG